MSDKKTSLGLFFTWDVSLSVWKEGGLLSRELRLYQALAKENVDITFFSWGGEEEKALMPELPQGIKIIPIYSKLPRPKNKALRALCSLLMPFYFRKDLKKCDILKTNQMWGGWYAALSALLYRKPLIARTGYELYDFTKKQGHGFLRCGFIYLISWLTYRTADLVCVGTAEDKNFVEKTFGIKPDKIDIRPNWIDTTVFKPLEISKKSKSILYVGRLNPQKNLKILIDAIADTDWTLDLVGDGELRGQLEEHARRVGAKTNFLGFQPNDQLPTIYNSYRVFVLPSHYEGNPKTLLEAMACNAAVIGTNVPGIASVIEHEKSGLLTEANVQHLKAAISRLIEDDALCTRLGEQARRQIEENQTLDSLLAKELACYKVLVK